ncbi:MAG TPA: type IV toxin-antitoxin system AbiEi family antitoxin domain-containing protein, partial [Solirubrobacteraceae bacterium]|nr:type IV toxin-antitoxin system AbiEi family antitoxin domain-containing protein [Solirubrobacteraceae bacterium]
MAARQHGVITRAQLRACGVTDRMVTGWLANGRLHRVHRGVFALGHPALSREGRWMAAVVACGEGAVLSHRSAAHLQGLIDRSPSLTDVTPPRAGGPVKGIRRHRSRRLTESDVTTHVGIPVTAVERTLNDLADVETDRVLRRALRQADVLYGVTPSSIDGRRGASRLRAEPERSRSELERTFARLCEEHRLPRPEHNVTLGGVEVDFLWRGRGLVVELDGWRYHRSRQAFEDDRARDQALARAGHRVLRFT